MGCGVFGWFLHKTDKHFRHMARIAAPACVWSRPAERGGTPFAVLRSHLRLLSANDMALWSSTEVLTGLEQHGRGATSHRRHRIRTITGKLI